MKDHLRAHLKHMIVGGVAVLALLIVVGVSFPNALIWALLLACPIGMIGMMWFMGRQDGHGHGHEGHAEHIRRDHDHRAEPAGTVPGPGGLPSQRGNDR